MLRAKALTDIGQECFNNYKDENIHCLLCVIGEKIEVALRFFDKKKMIFVGWEQVE